MIKTVINLSKPIVSEETFLGQIIHTIDVVQGQTVEKFKTWVTFSMDKYK